MCMCDGGDDAAEEERQDTMPPWPLRRRARSSSRQSIGAVAPKFASLPNLAHVRTRSRGAWRARPPLLARVGDECDRVRRPHVIAHLGARARAHACRQSPGRTSAEHASRFRPRAGSVRAAGEEHGTDRGRGAAYMRVIRRQRQRQRAPRWKPRNAVYRMYGNDLATRRSSFSAAASKHAPPLFPHARLEFHASRCLDPSEPHVRAIYIFPVMRAGARARDSAVLRSRKTLRPHLPQSDKPRFNTRSTADRSRATRCARRARICANDTSDDSARRSTSSRSTCASTCGRTARTCRGNVSCSSGGT